MAKVYNVILLLVGLVCCGVVSEAAELDELEERLTSLEDTQQRLREMMSNLETKIDIDVNNVTQFCQDLKMRVAEQRRLLEALKENVDERSTSSPQQSTSVYSTSIATSTVTPSFDNCGPCSADNHTVIDDPRRVAVGEYSGYEDMCDRELEEGWYRFLLDGEKAVIPTSCVPENNCHTDAPTWMDLQGQALPSVGEEIGARACSHWNDDCCNWQVPMRVLNCGEYYVYRLSPLSTCDLSFCVETQD